MRPHVARPWLAAATGGAALAVVLSGCSSGTDTAAPPAVPSQAASSAPVPSTAPSTAPTTAPTDVPSTTGSPSSSASRSSDPAATELLNRASTALQKVQKMQVMGKGAQSGSPLSTIDLALERGVGASGQIGSGNVKLELRLVGTSVYAKVTDELLTSLKIPDAAGRLFKGKWLKLADAQAKPFQVFGNLDTLTKQIIEPSGAVTLGPAGDVDGRPAQALDSGTGRLWIATEGEPLPLRIGPASGDTSTGLTFGYDDVQVAGPPPQSDVVDVAELSKLGRS